MASSEFDIENLLQTEEILQTQESVHVSHDSQSFIVVKFVEVISRNY